MNAGYNDSNLGEISIDNEVIRDVALKAATDVQGIYKIRENFINRIWNILVKRGSANGVTLEFKNNSEVTITLKLMIEYGTNITHIASLVQENVKRVVGDMTGLAVSKVIIRIVGICTEKNTASKTSPKRDLDKSSYVKDESASMIEEVVD